MRATATALSLIHRFRQARDFSSIYQKIRGYRNFVDLQFDTGGFTVTTARDGQQLLQALELRHEIFIEEWQERKAHQRPANAWPAHGGADQSRT